MHLNTDPDEPPGKPCIRDFAELVNVHLPPANVIKALPLTDLERRCDEIVVEHPHLREEVPLVLAGETRRRKNLQHLRAGAMTVRKTQVA
jgi:hypothetical protein